MSLLLRQLCHHFDVRAVRVQTRDVVVLLRRSLLKHRFELMRDFFQCFQTVGGKTRTQHVHADVRLIVPTASAPPSHTVGSTLRAKARLIGNMHRRGRYAERIA